MVTGSASVAQRGWRWALVAVALAAICSGLVATISRSKRVASDPPGATPAVAFSAATPARTNDPPPIPSRSGSPPRVSPGAAAVDLRAVMAQVHHAFRLQGGEFRAAHTTYEIAVKAGAITFTPWHHPRGGVDGPLQGSPVRLGAAKVVRGGALVTTGEATASTDEKAQLQLVRGGIVERLVSRPEGVEQSWSFDAPPEGKGDIEVRIALRGGAVVGETEGGIHLAGGTLGVRYGRATWIDRLGSRTPVRARVEAGEIVMVVPAGVVEGSLYPAVLDPVISPELELDTPVYGPAPGDQAYPAISWNGATHLVVWRDQRAGQYGRYAVFGARVTPAGVVEDPAGIAISSATAYSAVDAAVSWDGASHLVLWTETVWKAGGIQTTEVHGARVGADGVVRDSPGFPIAPGPGEQSRPAVAWNGTSHLVVWQDRRNGTDLDLYGARVGADGVVKDPSAFLVATGPGDQGSGTAAPSLSVSWGGTSHLVVWEDSRNGARDIYGARVTADGAVLDPDPIAICTAANEQFSPRLSWSGTTHLVVWQDLRNDAGYVAYGGDVYGARVGPDGVVLDRGGFPISTAPYQQAAPWSSWNGATHLVVWEDQRGGGVPRIFGARVSDAGVVLDVDGFPIAGPADPASTFGQYSPVVAWDGQHHLVVWGDAGNPGRDQEIYGARVSAEGVVQDPSGLRISGVADAQSTPALSWDGTNHLLVWQDLRGGSWDIYGALVSADGAIRDAAGIAICTATNDQLSPAVSWNGTSHLVVWQDFRSAATTGSSDLYGARVSAAGVLLDADPIVISTSAYDQAAPALAWDGENHLIVWQTVNAGTGWDIQGARVSADGIVQDPAAIAISTAAGDQTAPRVSWNGTSHLVVWDDRRSSGSMSDVYAARVTAAGAVLDPGGLRIASSDERAAPAISWDGESHLVVWQRRVLAGTLVHNVFGTLVSPAGLVLAPEFRICPAPYEQVSPAASSDGSDHLVLWHDRRSGSGSGLYGARVSSVGTVRERDGVLLAAGSNDHSVAAPSAPRQFLVAYDALDGSPGFGTNRIRARTVAFDAAPIAQDVAVSVPEDSATAITLAATDADGDPLTFTVLSAPVYGTLAGTPPDLLYTPMANYSGGDWFRFQVDDGHGRSDPATVHITVTPVNDPPWVQLAASVTVAQDDSVAITLRAGDVDGDPLTYTVVSYPSHGTLTGTLPGLTYAPAPRYSGPDAFSWIANDGAADSDVATVSITVTPANHPPFAPDVVVTVAENGSVPIILAATDVDGDALTFTLVAGPSHGTLSGAPPTLTYAPDQGYSGADGFTFEVSDGAGGVALPTASITVTPAAAPGPPAGGCGCATGSLTESVLGTLALVLARRRAPRRR